jgi:hypothetical protein
MEFWTNDLLILTQVLEMERKKDIYRTLGKIMYVNGTEMDTPQRVFSLGPLADSSKTLFTGACMVLWNGGLMRPREDIWPQFRVRAKRRNSCPTCVSIVSSFEDAFVERLRLCITLDVARSCERYE